ncbi:hypothetical protein O7600_07215 [Micromonospora sp. WMMA1998]|uniref:Uncharacterized protein n=1 Tax=Micromonospora sediminicola TaxID=946078 RepID=A0A1A9BAF5_9ACTN|nr:MULTISPECIES: hypothetical protein [Micromonospora]WBC16623.1 hypothetical protein O7600_07215 [Micromonospora sp. WMMA1998]SBT65959.1 hypothetical protein GA0070622_2975 [Micromonospora sediminicola]
MENGERERTNERFEKVAGETSETVTHAASVLEEELAAGLAGARRLEEKLSADRRVDPEAFDELVARVRTDGHALIDTVVAQLKMADDQRGEVVRRYTSDAHDALDTVLNLARLAPDVANGLADRLATPAPRSRPRSEK